MKTKHSYQWNLGVWGTLILLTSCMGFLDEQPIAQLTPEQAFDDPVTAQQVVNAMYDPLVWGEVGTLSSPFSHAYEFIFGDICTDDAEKGSLPGDQADIQRLKEFNTDGGNANLESIWNHHWVAINRANQVLESVLHSSLDEDLKRQYQAEARFVRGYSYFLLARIFGGLPRLEAPVDLASVEANAFTRVPLYKIYQLIDADFAFATAHLPPKGIYEDGRANQGAAAGYQIRAILYQLGTDNTNGHTWQNLVDLTKRFTQEEFGHYTLVNNYATLFEFEGENCEESIWEIQAIDGGNNANREDIGPFAGSQWTVVQQPQSLGGWGFNTPTLDLVAMYAPNDPRRPATAIAIGEHAYGQRLPADDRNQTGYYSRKAIIEPGYWQSQKGSGQNIRKLRYADILLMQAEAAWHVGDFALSRQRLIEIRARASQSTFPMGWEPEAPEAYPATGFAPLPESDIPMAGEELLAAIWAERRRELGMEQLRFWDLVRTGRYYEAIRASYRNLENVNDEFHAERIVHAVSRCTIRPEPEQVLVNPIPVFPLPAVDIADWGLTQNPGY